MFDPLTISWLVICMAIGAPIVVFCAECFAAMLPAGWKDKPADQPAGGGRARQGHTHSPTGCDASPRTVVVVPAHDEAAGIGETLATIVPCLRENERALVVADNCTDETAPLARIGGAEVIVRRDPLRRGKGYAVDFALAHLEADPPDVVVIVDADCRADRGLVTTIAAWAHRTGRPVQARNLVETDAPHRSSQSLSVLGFRFKNLVRPTGLARLGLPCQLMGTGMAIPWSALRDVRLCGKHLAEDMQLGIDLAVAGYPPLFRSEVGVASLVPRDRRAFVSQRTRWEQGHLATLLAQAPRLAWEAFRKRRIDLLGMACDLAVPPLSLLMTTWGAALPAALLWGVFGRGWWPAMVLAGQGALMAAAVSVGWWKFCRCQVPIRVLLAAPFYVMRKLPIYVSFLFKRQKAWIRTGRDAAGSRPSRHPEQVETRTGEPT